MGWICITLLALFPALAQENDAQRATTTAEAAVRLAAELQQVKAELRWVKLENLSRRMALDQQDIERARSEAVSLQRELCSEAGIPTDRCNINIDTRAVVRTPDPAKPAAQGH